MGSAGFTRPTSERVGRQRVPTLRTIGSRLRYCCLWNFDSGAAAARHCRQYPARPWAASSAPGAFMEQSGTNNQGQTTILMLPSVILGSTLSS
jgi:hypothetical protein